MLFGQPEAFYVVPVYPAKCTRVHVHQNCSNMDFMTRLEPKFSTLIQAAVITFLLVLISFVYDNEEKTSAEMQAVAEMRR